MIEETYVSFETAKLLKEKGFDEPCFIWINKNGFRIREDISLDIEDIDEGQYLCPTQQMAMAWLREIHKLHITVFSSSQESWMYRITKPHQQLEDGVYAEDFYSYEKACEAAIKYALKNMI